MIQANELRIGNWVEWVYPNRNNQPNKFQFCQIESIRDSLVGVLNSAYGYDQIQPIHLTPEILGKLEGFEMILWNGVFRQYYISITNSTVLSLFFGEYIGFENRLDKVTFGTHPHYSGCTYGNLPVKYLHQLQNLYFALTGEELTFKP